MGGQILFFIFATVMSVVWILVPFAIFGVRSLMRELLAEQRRTNELLTHIGGYRIPPPAPAPRPWQAP